jgi:hypothetical protein
MRFVLRLAFWLGVVVLALAAAPSERTAPRSGADIASVSSEAAAAEAPRDTLAPADVAEPWRPPRSAGSGGPR